MNYPLVSIVLATFNGELYIKEQIVSLLNQTYSNLEIIISDDNSTDMTFSILSDYSNVPNVKIIRNEVNLGYIKNFELALSFCNGEFIAFCDQDDIWFPNKIQTLVDSINGSSLIWSDTSIIDKSGKLMSFSLNKNLQQDYEQNLQFKILLGNSILGCTSLFRREVLDSACPFPKSNPPHDWWISLIACKIHGMKYYPKPLMKWRRHTSTDTSPSTDDFRNPYFRFFKFILFFLNYKELSKFRKNIRKERFHFQNIYEDLIKMDLFSESEKYIFNELISMYKSINSHKFRFKGFKILFRYKDYLFPEKKVLLKWGRLFLIWLV